MHLNMNFKNTKEFGVGILNIFKTFIDFFDNDKYYLALTPESNK